MKTLVVLALIASSVIFFATAEPVLSAHICWTSPDGLGGTKTYCPYHP